MYMYVDADVHVHVHVCALVVMYVFYENISMYTVHVKGVHICVAHMYM